MLSLQRNHDFQVFMSPGHEQEVLVNPPSFNWPQPNYNDSFSIELEHTNKPLQWCWENVSSPFQLPFTLPQGEYRWRLVNAENQATPWFSFNVTEKSEDYLAPTAKELFERCQPHEQFLMYFDEDINHVRISSWMAYDKLKKTAELADIEAITYPTHYRRGEEEGKRTAIANVRKWIDRDLISLSLLYKIWGDKQSGETAVSLLLKLAEWSPEGPASLLRPCTWGDEVGLSLARNLYLAYHWLAPLLTESEKSFVRSMLVRIAYQMEERLEQDQFKQFPGHSHTSRLPAYLGVAALALHKEFDQSVCERWLNYSLMIYRGVLPFYGGEDGSWAEGPFYSSSYSKWFHPFFLSVERISGFSFYNHPFYKNYSNFAMDFVATQDDIHPFGDGFWCKRDGDEWPGFFAQNPLRIYAERFGDRATREMSLELEQQIPSYDLHLLDVVPTISQIKHSERPLLNLDESQESEGIYSKYYDFAGLGAIKSKRSSVFFRASQFGNSSHRHADQGNIALIDSHTSVLTPSGSYGYRFGSAHHSEWTRTTKAHNLPLIAGKGQILDDESATASVITHKKGANWSVVQMDLSRTYCDAKRFIRTLVTVADKGVLIVDNMSLASAQPVQWRLHSPLNVDKKGQHVLLGNDELAYTVKLLADELSEPRVEIGYQEETSLHESVVSDANQDIRHIEWQAPPAAQHTFVACCENSPIYHDMDNAGLLKVDIGEGIIVIDIDGERVQKQAKQVELA
ncbi:heparinase II/III domain-containing protein [Vibrio superstes]|uniref:Oligo alginate lyase n=1 Tax=Vibrio superstes NBRC 103154 TaxID=1219062 RepID=A0A511QN87_9VIBR|nr:heparinase II/III family protein [Vibrio superstes]GEM78781.1 oligo alginate lyase [Vibrio superstes NBRC 103154]